MFYYHPGITRWRGGVMGIACLLVDRLPIKAEVQRAPALRGRPVLIAQGSGSRRVVLDASIEARGVVPGMLLSEALSQCKGAALVEPDLTYYRAVFDEVLTAIEGLGADVEEEDLGECYVRLSGLELLYGGEERLLRALIEAVPGYLDPRVGVGPNKFVSNVAAYSAGARQTNCAPSRLEPFLGPLPVELLPVSWQTIARMKGFGLHRLGQLAGMSVGALQAQFGPQGKTMGELARGVDPRPLIPRRHQEVATASLAFAEPIGTFGIVVTAIESLLISVFAQERMRGRFARVCTVEGSLFRAPAWHRRMVFKEPLGNHAKALSVIRSALENVPPPGALEDLRLTLSSITGEGGHQESLFRDVRRQENLREALRQLHERLGDQPPIYHVREVEPWSRLPERRLALVPFAP